MQAADILVLSDLRGHESHGVSNMLRRYVFVLRHWVRQSRPSDQNTQGVGRYGHLGWRRRPGTSNRAAGHGTGDGKGGQVRHRLRGGPEHQTSRHARLLSADGREARHDRRVHGVGWRAAHGPDLRRRAEIRYPPVLMGGSGAQDAAVRAGHGDFTGSRKQARPHTPHRFETRPGLDHQAGRNAHRRAGRRPGARRLLHAAVRRNPRARRPQGLRHSRHRGHHVGHPVRQPGRVLCKRPVIRSS